MRRWSTRRTAGGGKGEDAGGVDAAAGIAPRGIGSAVLDDGVHLLGEKGTLRLWGESGMLHLFQRGVGVADDRRKARRSWMMSWTRS